MMREISLDEAKPIWDRFVPDKQVWTDDWDIRVAICKEYCYEPHILYDGDNFFPLQYEPDNGFHTIIGGETAEKNYLTFDPRIMKETKEIPDDIYFDFLVDRFDGCVEGACPQFFIDLAGINGLEDYAGRFSGKHRKNFMRAYRRFGDYEFVRQGTLGEMADMNVEAFGAESDFVTENRACYEILDQDQRTEYWSVVKGGKAAMISQCFFYGSTMSICGWGADRKCSDTLKVALAEGIALAKSRGCTRIDYAPTYSGWKTFYRLDTAPLWRYKRGNIPASVEKAGYGVPPDELGMLRAKGRL